MRALGLLALATAAPALALPAPARATPQLSLRLGVGGGAILLEDAGDEGVFELALRSELLFGPPEARAVRVGPALDLRTGDFVTAEAAAGLALLLPVATGFPLTVTAAAGWASRPADGDGAFALGTLAWGYRSYNHHHLYGYGLQIYASARASLEGPARWEVSGGVEIDLLFLIAVPAIFLWEWLTGGDPDEPSR